MYIQQGASKERIREAENARRNRAEIVKALSTGQVSRRELFKWGIFTSTGALACINGLSPFAQSALAAGSDNITGVPRSPTFGVQPFTQKLPRLNLQSPLPLTPAQRGQEIDVVFPYGTEWHAGRRMSYHTDFSATDGELYVNPMTKRGPMEGRPPGEYFAHQRWREYLPKVGFVMSHTPVAKGWSFHPDMPPQEANAVWTFASGQAFETAAKPPLIKMRYGEPALFRNYNMLPENEHDNGGFGSISQSTHNHNAHNASASDGASNAHFFPGQFYDYHWSTTLARADSINTDATDPRASGPDGNGGLIHLPGDYRELQSSLWFHDHRFFFTAENVYKGHVGMLNYYSGPDRGNETLQDGVNLRLPSGSLLDWGNIDFDVNLMISDGALDKKGQYFFDIFNTDGFVGDLMLVNFAYKPFFEVLPRKYRFRILNAGMSRFVQLQLRDRRDRIVPMTVIATDGNLITRPVTVSILDQQSIGERLDVVIDFTNFRIGDRLKLYNMLSHQDGRGADNLEHFRDIQRGKVVDPGVGALLEFRIVGEVDSVDVPGVRHRATQPDPSRVPLRLTDPIPVVEPVRVRLIEFRKGGDDPRDSKTGECTPDCPDREAYPYTMRVNGERSHAFNANRISTLIPRPGEVEHWVLRNPGGGWDHPVHLHFEEGVTIDRGLRPLSEVEKGSRKDVWAAGRTGEVRIQVQFGEYGGAFVSHCHNTLHEDSAMIMRFDVLTDPNDPRTSRIHAVVVPTPHPTERGVTYSHPEITPEGNPFSATFKPFPSLLPD
ncbi:multicopper oxidase domain-containing protein [uncultured Limimaricola sp.]|uniref:multicopper oxidase family protein n=1 Tax=uncultured Limimaricola sp. TaxID=2211667 RepID=UPI0030F98322